MDFLGCAQARHICATAQRGQNLLLGCTEMGGPVWDGHVELWELAEGDKFSHKVKAHRSCRSGVCDLVFGDRSRVYVGCDNGDIEVLQASDLAEEGVLGEHTGAVTRLLMTPKEDAMLSASADGTVRLWDLENNEARVMTGHSACVHDIALKPGKEPDALVSASADTTLRLWDLRECEQVARHWRPPKESQGWRSVTWFGEHQIAAVGDAGLFSMFDARNFKHPVFEEPLVGDTFRGPLVRVQHIAGMRFIAMDTDPQVYVVDTEARTVTPLIDQSTQQHCYSANVRDGWVMMSAGPALFKVSMEPQCGLEEPPSGPPPAVP